MYRILLFDIDGTLVSTGGAGAVAWRRAFDDLYGIPADIGRFTDAGMTDPDVGAQTFAAVLHRDPTPHELAQLLQRRLEYLPEAVAESTKYRVLPGVPERLRQLSRDGHLLGIITGNGDGAAHIKLARGDLNRFFAFGGYGSDSRDRTELTKKALERGGQVSGKPLEHDQTIGVGDTPRDVKACHGAGIHVVGVATGSYTVDELKTAGADWAIPDVTSGFPA